MFNDLFCTCFPIKIDWVNRFIKNWSFIRLVLLISINCFNLLLFFIWTNLVLFLFLFGFWYICWFLCLLLFIFLLFVHITLIFLFFTYTTSVFIKSCTWERLQTVNACCCCTTALSINMSLDFILFECLVAAVASESNHISVWKTQENCIILWN